MGSRIIHQPHRPWSVLLIAVLACGVAAGNEGGAEESAMPDDRADPVFDHALGNAPEITLRDQFREKHRLGFPCDVIRIIGVADEHSHEMVQAWHDAVADSYADKPVDIIGIAALDGFFFLWRPWLKWYLRQHVEEALLLDWKNKVPDALGWTPKTLNVFVASPDGQLVLHLEGAFSEEKQQRLDAALRALLEKLESPKIEPGAFGEGEQTSANR